MQQFFKFLNSLFWFFKSRFTSLSLISNTLVIVFLHQLHCVSVFITLIHDCEITINTKFIVVIIFSLDSSTWDNLYLLLMDSPIWNNLFHRTFSQRTHFQNKICFLKILFKVISFILPLHKFSTCLTVLNDPTSEMYLVRCSLSLNCIFPFDFFTVLAFSGLLTLNKLISSFVFLNSF